MTLTEAIKNAERAVSLKDGDTVNVQGHIGTATEINHTTAEDGAECTYFKATFNDELKATGYNNSFYGSSNWAFTY